MEELLYTLGNVLARWNKCPNLQMGNTPLISNGWQALPLPEF
jgi:hypothetical protein